MGGQLSILTRMAGKLLSSTYGANAECNFIYKKSKKDVARVRAKVALVKHLDYWRPCSHESTIMYNEMK